MTTAPLLLVACVVMSAGTVSSGAVVSRTTTLKSLGLARVPGEVAGAAANFRCPQREASSRVLAAGNGRRRVHSVRGRHQVLNYRPCCTCRLCHHIYRWDRQYRRCRIPHDHVESLGLARVPGEVAGAAANFRCPQREASSRVLAAGNGRRRVHSVRGRHQVPQLLPLLHLSPLPPHLPPGPSVQALSYPARPR